MYCKNKNSSRLASKINSILANHSMNFKQIDYITISIGPGTFTGIRVGLSLAQGLAFAEKIPIVPVNIMDVLHSQLSDESSKELVEFSINNYNNLATKNIDSIEPIYLNEYNTNLQL